MVPCFVVVSIGTIGKTQSPLSSWDYPDCQTQLFFVEGQLQNKVELGSLGSPMSAREVVTRPTSCRQSIFF